MFSNIYNVLKNIYLIFFYTDFKAAALVQCHFDSIQMSSTLPQFSHNGKENFFTPVISREYSSRLLCQLSCLLDGNIFQIFSGFAMVP